MKNKNLQILFFIKFIEDTGDGSISDKIARYRDAKSSKLVNVTILVKIFPGTEIISLYLILFVSKNSLIISNLSLVFM